ncbi:hypothetical protein NPIL_572761 [Nephila pilipes]|uniref:Uncharacterized protein n=1 Tax=Nephila pilipes TaxID=299642 RepID=A0A8X6PH74_NEPPI|nr:hypothetical protein NPIL_572761 [Nephila pilipes]
MILGFLVDAMKFLSLCDNVRLKDRERKCLYLKLPYPNITYQCSLAEGFSLLPTSKIHLWKRYGLLPTVIELEKVLLATLHQSTPGEGQASHFT